MKKNRCLQCIRMFERNGNASWFKTKKDLKKKFNIHKKQLRDGIIQGNVQKRICTLKEIRVRYLFICVLNLLFFFFSGRY